MAWNKRTAEISTPHSIVMQEILDKYPQLIAQDGFSYQHLIAQDGFSYQHLAGGLPRLSKVTESGDFQRAGLLTSPEANFVIRERVDVSCYFMKEGCTLSVEIYAPDSQDADKLNRFSEGLQKKLDEASEKSFAAMHGR